MGNCVQCVPTNEALVNILSESKNFEYVIFSKSTCPDCIKARTFLFSQNKLPKIIEMNRTHKDLRNALSVKTKKERPPYIFFHGEYIGGLEELGRHLKKESLIE